jgi:type IV secretion system protein VirB10
MKVAICFVIAASLLQANGIEGTAQPYVVDSGLKIPLSLMNTISSKQAAEGDRVYLETMYPVLVNGKIVIPPGSYVAGTVTQVKRPGRIKGKGELYLRFDSMTLPNGVTREFKARVGGLEGGASNELDRSEGKIKGNSDKGGDAQTIAQGAQLGTMVGGIAGAATGRPLSGLGMGGAGGAAAGLAGVLLTRGPDVVLQKGTMLEMVVDRPLTFEQQDLDFSNVVQTRPTRVIAAPAEESSKSRSSRWPFPF